MSVVELLSTDYTDGSDVLRPVVAESNITNVENLMSAEVVRAMLYNTGEPMFRVAKRGANRERQSRDEHFQFESDS